MEQDKTGYYIKTAFQIALAVGAAIALKKVFDFIGITKSQDTKNVEGATGKASASSLDIQSDNPYIAFNPNYASTIIKAYNNKYGAGKFNSNYQSYKKLVTAADKLYDAKGLFHDNNDEAYSTFRDIQTLFQLSQLAWYFNNKKGRDLLEYLKTFLNDSEMQPILDQVKNYPAFLPQ
jgi:uncharacterized protein YktA (UPF0223 family)